MIAIILITIFILAFCWEEWEIVKLLSPFMIGVIAIFFIVGVGTWKDLNKEYERRNNGKV